MQISADVTRFKSAVGTQELERTATRTSESGNLLTVKMQQRFSALQRMYPSIIYRRALSSAVNCSLMTVPLTFGQPHAGADMAPIQLINSGLLKQLKRLGKW